MEFHELSFAEQARTITAALENLQLEIEYHVENAPRATETIEKCLAEVDRLRDRLKTALEQRAPRAESARSPSGAAEVRRVRVWSPRLAEPERAADFVLEVAEVSPDAGL